MAREPVAGNKLSPKYDEMKTIAAVALVAYEITQLGDVWTFTDKDVAVGVEYAAFKRCPKVVFKKKTGASESTTQGKITYYDPATKLLTQNTDISYVKIGTFNESVAETVEWVEIDFNGQMAL